MNTTSMRPDRRALAVHTAQLLGQLAGEIEAANNPHRLARRSLRINQYGGTRDAYGGEAFQIWTDLLLRSSEDLETLHHLAIMHHARAFDRECGPAPASSDPDWEAALSYWHLLWMRDDFWESLSEKLPAVSDRTRVIADLKKSWPEQILQVHFDIAFDPATSRARSLHHVKLALDSRFPPVAKEEVRRRTYDRWISTVDDMVWQNDMQNPEIIQSGTEVIESFLDRDPGCVAALTDLLRLQTRLLLAQFQQLSAAGEEGPERERLIREIGEAATRWSPRFDLLLAGADHLEEDIRQKLCFWYRTMGEAHQAMKKHGESVTYYERGTRAAADEAQKRQMQNRVVEALALEAREVALSSDPEEEARAKVLADKVRQRSGLSIPAHRYVANAYMLIREFDLAEQLAEAGLRLEPDSTDLEVLEKAEEQKAGIRDLLETIKTNRRRHQVQALLGEAAEDLKGDRFAEASRKLDRAIRLDPNALPAYFLRCQCHLALVHPKEARADVETFRRLGTEAKDADSLKAAEQLSHECDELTLNVDQFGAEGVRLRRAATAEFQANRFDQAETLLRQAIEHSPAKGKKNLQSELAIVLAAHSVEAVNAAAEDKSASAAEKEKVARRALVWSQEAVRLDPQNPRARSNLTSLQGILENLEKARKMEEEYGGARAVELQQLAVGAFNEGNHDKAIKYLRQAIQHSSRPARVKEELSDVLAGIAVAKVNTAQGAPSDSVLRHAAELLDEALQLNPQNARARENQRLLENLRTQAEQKAALLREYGGARAFELRQKAVQAFNSNDHESAIKYLRQAIRVSTQPDKLKEELSGILASSAVAIVNAAMQRIALSQSSGVRTTDARSSLLRAQEMLEEAVDLNPFDAHARTNLETLRNLTRFM